MDLNPSAEQQQLIDAYSTLYAKESSAERVRAAEPSGFDPVLWERLLETGVLEMAVDEASGGWGASLLDLALVAEQHGRHLGSGPAAGGAGGGPAAGPGPDRGRPDAVGPRPGRRPAGDRRPPPAGGGGAPPGAGRRGGRPGGLPRRQAPAVGRRRGPPARRWPTWARCRWPTWWSDGPVELAGGAVGRRGFRDGARRVDGADGQRPRRAGRPCARDRGRVRQGAAGLRGAHRVLPGGGPRAGRRGDRRRWGRAAGPGGGMGGGRGRRAGPGSWPPWPSPSPPRPPARPAIGASTTTAATASCWSTTSSCTSGGPRPGRRSSPSRDVAYARAAACRLGMEV